MRLSAANHTATCIASTLHFTVHCAIIFMLPCMFINPGIQIIIFRLISCVFIVLHLSHSVMYLHIGSFVYLPTVLLCVALWSWRNDTSFQRLLNEIFQGFVSISLAYTPNLSSNTCLVVHNFLCGRKKLHFTKFSITKCDMTVTLISYIVIGFILVCANFIFFLFQSGEMF